MKNLSKEEVRTAEEFFRELFKPDFSTQQTWNSNFKHFNTFDMIQFAESYASQFKSKSEAVGEQKEKKAFEAGAELGWCKVHKTYEQWKSEQ